MKQRLTILMLCCLLSSCATIMNRPLDTMMIYTAEPAMLIVEKDTIRTVNNKAKLRLGRGIKPAEIVVETDSLTKRVTIPAKNSSAYYSNIVFNFGIGMLIEKKSEKRYGYPAKVYLNSSDTVNKFYRYMRRDETGAVLLHVSLPYINSFQLKPDQESIRSNTGFWGLSIGLDYYHSSNQFVNVSISGVTDFFLPVPAAADQKGERESMSAIYLSLSNNHKVQRFSFGYGLSFDKNNWNLKYDEQSDSSPGRAPAKKSNYALGMLGSSYFQVGQNFNIGLIYRPSFVRFNSVNNFQYEHLISLDLAWKIKL